MNEAAIKDQVYNLEREYQQSLEGLGKDKNISQANKETIRQFVQDKISLGIIKKTRAIILFDHLRRLVRLQAATLRTLKNKTLKACWQRGKGKCETCGGSLRQSRLSGKVFCKECWTYQTITI